MPSPGVRSLTYSNLAGGENSPPVCPPATLTWNQASSRRRRWPWVSSHGACHPAGWPRGGPPASSSRSPVSRRPRARDPSGQPGTVPRDSARPGVRPVNGAVPSSSRWERWDCLPPDQLRMTPCSRTRPLAGEAARASTRRRAGRVTRLRKKTEPSACAWTRSAAGSCAWTPFLGRPARCCRRMPCGPRMPPRAVTGCSSSTPMVRWPAGCSPPKPSGRSARWPPNCGRMYRSGPW